MPLRNLAKLDGVSDRLQNAALESLERLISGKWLPRHVLMHSDLWKGNILHGDSRLAETGYNLPTRSFATIDWGASNIKGYGIYDLIRLGQSMRLSSRQLQAQVSIHCQILDSDFIDARSHLLTALGYLSMHLGCFPLNRFVELSHSCLNTLEQIGG
jgi:hypothetical protein